MSPDPSPTGVRLDIWLWATRLFKTRALAKRAVEGGKVAVGGAVVAKASKLVHPGDRLRVARGEDTFELDVLVPCAQRGPASVARTCYRETE